MKNGHKTNWFRAVTIISIWMGGLGQWTGAAEMGPVFQVEGGARLATRPDGTTLLTESYRPSERAKTQAAHDFLMFGAVSLGSLSAGGLLNTGGWESVNFTVLPFLIGAAAMVLWLGKLRARLGPAST